MQPFTSTKGHDSILYVRGLHIHAIFCPLVAIHPLLLSRLQWRTLDIIDSKWASMPSPLPGFVARLHADINLISFNYWYKSAVGTSSGKLGSQRSHPLWSCPSQGLLRLCGLGKLWVHLYHFGSSLVVILDWSRNLSGDFFVCFQCFSFQLCMCSKKKFIKIYSFLLIFFIYFHWAFLFLKNKIPLVSALSIVASILTVNYLHLILLMSSLLCLPICFHNYLYPS